MSNPVRAVFLSYASQDAEAVRRICEALRGAGVEVWFDQNELRGGDAWDAKIRGQIGSCALFVPVISATTQARREGYFRLEWKLGAQRTHMMSERAAFLVPVVLDATRDAEADVPGEFRAVQWTRLPGGETPAAFCERVKTLLGGSDVAPVSDRRLAVAGMDEAPSDTGQRPAPRRKRAPFALSAAAFAIAVGIVTALFVAKKSARPAVAAPPATTPTPAPAPPAAAPRVDAKSIAILPFANLSEDKDSAFFADGIHEDILTNLAGVRELRVTSRTSVMQYRATTKSLRQIAAELGVAFVLEGSVRRAGNKVRVTGQLIDARTDDHVWAKSYDRDLTDIFAIQAELSQAIAGALSAAISPEERTQLASRPTTNLAAYDLFVKARSALKGTGTVGLLTRAQAEQLLEDAVKLDPEFAEAWGYLSFAHANAVFSEEDHSPERLAKAKEAIDTAVRLAPADPVVIEMQGDYYYYGYRDYPRAAEHYQRLLATRPNSADALGQMAFLYRRQGRWTEAIATLRQVSELDPRNLNFVSCLGEVYAGLNRYDDADQMWRRLVQLAPDDVFRAESVPLNAFFARGSTREVDAWLAAQTPAAADEPRLLYFRRAWARLRGAWAEAVQIDREHPYLEPFDEPHWPQDVNAVIDLIGNNELSAAHAGAKTLIPALAALLEKQPANAGLWNSLAYLQAFEGDKESALRCARKSLELIPESADAMVGPGNSASFAQILAWTGDKDRALAELARLLRTPFGANVHAARHDLGWLPLRGDPRFEALLDDPKNNAPLL